jgi:hypothetical protein
MGNMRSFQHIVMKKRDLRAAGVCGNYLVATITGEILTVLLILALGALLLAF